MTEIAPQLFECLIDRAQTEIPSDYVRRAPEVIIAGKDMLLAAGYRKGSTMPPSGWLQRDGNLFQRPLYEIDPLQIPEAGKRVLQVSRYGDFWSVECLVTTGRVDPFSVAFGVTGHTLALVCAFGRRPILTRSCEASMRLADHCDPVPRPPVAACWVDVRRD